MRGGADPFELVWRKALDPQALCWTFSLGGMRTSKLEPKSARHPRVEKLGLHGSDPGVEE